MTGRSKGVLGVLQRYRMERRHDDHRIHNESGLPSLDVGCGFTEDIQIPVYATVSLDLNMGRVEAPFLAKLREEDSHPLGADACHLPIRVGCLGKVYWRAVLEHLPDPDAAIREGKRTLIPGGEAEIDLPIITSHMRHSLIALFTQFPFSLVSISVLLYQAHSYWRIPGVPHIRDVKPEYLRRYFREVKITKCPKPHAWFRGPHAYFTKALTAGRTLLDIQGQYLVRCR